MASLPLACIAAAALVACGPIIAQDFDAESLAIQQAVDEGLLKYVDEQRMAGVRCAGFSANGELLVYVNEAEGLAMVNARSLEPVPSFAPKRDKDQAVEWVAFMPGGKAVAAWNDSGEVVLHSVADGAIQHRWPLRPARTLEGPAIGAVPGSPAVIAVCGDGADIRVVYLNLESGARHEQRILGAEDNGVVAMALALDGSAFALIVEDSGLCQLFAVPSLAPADPFPVTEYAQAVAFDKSGNLAVADYDETKVHSAADRSKVRTLEIDLGDRPNYMAFDPSGNTLFFGEVIAVRGFDVATGDVVFEEFAEADVVLVTPHGRDGAGMLQCEEYGTTLLDVGTGAVLARTPGHRGPASGLAWSPDGKRVASCDGSGWMCIWDVDRAALVSSAAGGPFLAIPWRGGESPWVGVTAWNELTSWPRDGAPQPTRVAPGRGIDNVVRAVTSPAGTRLAAYLDDLTTVILRLDTLQWSEPFLPGGDVSQPLALSLDGGSLLAARENFAFVVRVATPEDDPPVISLMEPAIAGACLEGGALALLTGSGQLTFHRTATDKAFAELQLPESEGFLVASPSGDRVAVLCQGQVWVLSASADVLLHYATDDLDLLAWSHDGTKLAGMTGDCRVVAFEVPAK